MSVKKIHPDSPKIASKKILGGSPSKSILKKMHACIPDSSLVAVFGKYF